jgi:SAM-dependent methyltransferase
MGQRQTSEAATAIRAAATLPPCPSCAGRKSTAFYRIESAPVTCASVFVTKAEACAVARGTVELCVCDGCGFVFNRAFDPALAQIGAGYESSQAASGHFSAYARSLASDWVQRRGLRGKTVLEIGCGSGDFLSELLRAGVGKAIGLDPLIDCNRNVGELDDRLELIAAPFDEFQIGLEADAIVCRHTLEHVFDVHGFLRALARWARRNRDRVVLFEVPASERIFSECAFWDVYYEHRSYFTGASLRSAFARAGFEIQALASAFGDQYLLLEAGAAPSRSNTVVPCDVSAVRNTAFAFNGHAHRAIEQARSGMRALTQQGPLAIWQGAAKTVGFLTALADPALVSYAIDLNSHRHELYLPGGVKVVSPEQIATLLPRNIILMNPAYCNEVESSLRAMGSGARLFTVNEICGR